MKNYMDQISFHQNMNHQTAIMQDPAMSIEPLRVHIHTYLDFSKMIIQKSH